MEMTRAAKDIKPRTICLLPDREPMLVDFVTGAIPDRVVLHGYVPDAAGNFTRLGSANLRAAHKLTVVTRFSPELFKSAVTP